MINKYKNHKSIIKYTNHPYAYRNFYNNNNDWKVYEDGRLSTEYYAIRFISKIFDNEQEFEIWLNNKKIILRDLRLLDSGLVLCRYINV